MIKKPFKNETDFCELSGISLENRVDRISIHGQTDITNDVEGLEKAKKIRDALSHIIETMEENERLPLKIEIKSPQKIKNPF